MTELEYLRAIASAAWAYQETARGCGSASAYGALCDALYAMPEEMWELIQREDAIVQFRPLTPHPLP